jgi:hypothetical protein
MPLVGVLIKPYYWVFITQSISTMLPTQELKISKVVRYILKCKP